MTQKQIAQLQTVLKIEQQTLDNYLQLLQLKLTQLGKIRSEINSLTNLRESVLTPVQAKAVDFDVDSARNRCEFIQNLETAFVNVVDHESKQLELISAEKQKVNKQRSRVNAIEKMIERLQDEVQWSQNYFESIELGDTVLHKFMEHRS